MSKDVEESNEGFRRIWFLHKKYLMTKTTHGRTELLNQMTELEAKEFGKKVIRSPLMCVTTEINK